MSVNCVDIELAIMRKFDYRQNLIVTNISNMMGLVPFETDVLVISKSNYATGFEIKVSKSDLKADFKKPQHKNIDGFFNGKTGMQRYFGKFKYFNYAVPLALKECALELIPDFCGLWVYDNKEYPLVDRFYLAREPKKLFTHQWTEKEKYEIARLGTMRIYALKSAIKGLANEIKHFKEINTSPSHKK